MLLSTSHAKLGARAEAQLHMHQNLPGIPCMLGVPGITWEDPQRYPYSNSAPARFGGQPNSPSAAYMAQASTELDTCLQCMPQFSSWCLRAGHMDPC